jgi:hypothetical protein
MHVELREPRPVHFLLAWDAADLVVECLAQDQPRWKTEPDRGRLHRAVFSAVVRELEEAG